MRDKIIDLHVKWSKPLNLIDGSKNDLIYMIDDLDDYENVPGVYMFCRNYDGNLSPLYIGKTMNIALRTRQHFNETRLMKRLQKAKNGDKVLLIGQFIPHGKQSIKNWISFIEDVLIRQAIESGAELINKHGTIIKKHRIRFSGYAGGNEIFGKLIHC